MARSDIAVEIRRYLETGEHDMLFPAWSGENTVDRLNRGHRAMLLALVAEAKRRAGTPTVPAALAGLDLVDLGRRKSERMVRGLFPKAEQDVVLALVAKSVVFVTPDSIESVLLGCENLSSAWDVANLYLGAVNAEPLSHDALPFVGLSEDQTCYVSPAYFEERDPYADFVAHEVAHIFHNTRRHTAGLPETRRWKYLLDIHYSKRETFAYACEAYSRILERAREPARRRAMAQEFDGFKGIREDRVDPAEVADVVRAACERRNGWKVVLARCAGEQREAGGAGVR